jgi:peptidyl-prolyl cis-trans isomerase A (cyclophilin A)
MRRRTALLALLLFPALASCQQAERAAETETPAAAEATTPAAAPKIRLKTNHGDIVLELNAEKAPLTVKNFLSYVEKKHYDGTVFHRVIEDFMIQGGGYALKDGRLAEKPTAAPIPNEGQNGLRNDRGTIAMARTNDPNSATAQFFINHKNNNSLNYPSNGGYAVFGKVTEGMEVVDKIAKVQKQMGMDGTPSMPVDPVVIESATVVE